MRLMTSVKPSDPSAKSLEIVVGERIENIEEVYLYNAYTYPDKEKGINITDLLPPSSSSFTLSATDVGMHFFSEMVILEAVTYREESIYGVYIPMDKLIRCFIEGVVELEIEDCSLLVSSPCTCIEDIIHSFMGIEALETLLTTNNIALACKLYLSLCSKCSLNCIGLEELEEGLTLAYLTEAGEIVLRNTAVIDIP